MFETQMKATNNVVTTFPSFDYNNNERIYVFRTTKQRRLKCQPVLNSLSTNLFHE